MVICKIVEKNSKIILNTFLKQEIDPSGFSRSSMLLHEIPFIALFKGIRNDIFLYAQMLTHCQCILQSTLNGLLHSSVKVLVFQKKAAFNIYVQVYVQKGKEPNALALFIASCLFLL